MRDWTEQTTDELMEENNKLKDELAKILGNNKNKLNRLLETEEELTFREFNSKS